MDEPKETEKNTPVRQAHLPTMQELRDMRNDPAVKAKEKELSKKYLKHNRPKSLILVCCAAMLLFMVLYRGTFKAATVLDSCIRTDPLTVVCGTDAGTSEERAVSGEEQAALVSILQAAKVHHTEDMPAGGKELVFTCMKGGSPYRFSITGDGYLVTEKNRYLIESPEASVFWSRLEEAGFR